MEENNNLTPEVPKKKGNVVTNIITVVLIVIAYKLFGILETAIGLAAGYGLRALLKKSMPSTVARRFPTARPSLPNSEFIRGLRNFRS